MRLHIIIGFSLLLATPERGFVYGSRSLLGRSTSLIVDSSYAVPLNPSTEAAFVSTCPVRLVRW